MPDRRRANKIQDRLLLAVLAANVVMLAYCGFYLSDFMQMVTALRRFSAHAL